MSIWERLKLWKFLRKARLLKSFGYSVIAIDLEHNIVGKAKRFGSLEDARSEVKRQKANVYIYVYEFYARRVK